MSDFWTAGGPLMKTPAMIRDRYGWHPVLTADADSVTVETDYPWTERVSLDDVLEVR